MERISTNLTLFYKLFIPTFWIVFFGAFTIAVWAVNYEYYGNIPGKTFRLGTALFYLSGLSMLYFTLMQLKRVEVDGESVYITNYFKHFRYPYHSIEKIEESDFFFLKTASIYFIKPGTFGKKVTFIPSRSRYRQFWESHRELRKRLWEKVKGDG